MAVKLCDVCGKRRPGTGKGDEHITGLCNPCATEGGWENTHSDHNHDGIAAGQVTLETTSFKTQSGLDSYLEQEREYMENCWICHPELNLAQKPVKASTGTKKQGFRRPQLNHKGHNHPQTPAARRACKTAFWDWAASTEGPKDLTFEHFATWNHQCDMHGKPFSN